MAASNDATQIISLGSFFFAGIGLLVSLLVVYITFLLHRSEKSHATLQRDMEQIREQQVQTNNTLIVTSDLAIASLPQITFTQQIPESILDDVSIIDDIFLGARGSALWESIASQPRAARLAYARAVYRLGMFPLSKTKLLSGGGTTGPSVIALLELAEAAVDRTHRDPLALRTDIVVRRVQALRQAGAFDQAMAASEGLDDIGDEYGDDRASILCAWCRAIICLQRGFAAAALADRRSAFAAAADHLQGPFLTLFGRASDRPARGDSDRVSDYQARWPRIELGSIAYYYLKSLVALRFADPAPDHSGAAGSADAKLIRALDLSLLFYEDRRKRLEKEPGRISCIYHLCVPLLIAVHLATPASVTGLSEFFDENPRFKNRENLVAHARECLKRCERLAEDIQRVSADDAARFIYSEGSERIDRMKRFLEDLRIVESALVNTAELSRLFQGSIA